MNSSNNMSAAPGLGFKVLLSNAKPALLRELIGPLIFDILQGLDPKLISDQQFGELAARLVDPSEALCDLQRRKKIVRMLDVSKARELSEKLGVLIDKNLYNNLSRIVADKDVLPELFSFFGIVEDQRAPEDRHPDIEEVTAGYLLFDHQRKACG